MYKGFKRNSTGIGFFIKGSARVVEPPRFEYKGFKYKYNLKGDICRSWVVRTNSVAGSYDCKSIRFYDNAVINIKKKNNPLSKFLNGPISRSIKKKKLLTLFKVII